MAAELVLEPLGLFRDRVEHALLLAQPAEALLRRARVAEHALERHLRIDRDGQRAEVVVPRDRVEEHAREAVACAGGRAHVFRAHFERAHRRVFSDDVRDVLVDRLLRFDLAVVTSRVDGPDAVQERGARADVHRTVRRLHLAHGHQVIAIRLERLHDRLELETRADLGRVPELRVHAIGHIDRTEAQRPLRARLAEGRHHRIQHRQSDRSARAA